MRLMLVAFALLLAFFLSSCVKLSHTEHAPHYLLYCIFENLPQEFAVAICRENLPQEFAVAICRENLRWVFCMCKRIPFCICEQILFLWKQTFFICDQNFLIREILFINSVSFCYCCGSYGPPYFPN